ncbi:hypothetical protein LCGC14_0347310 [marine sediment metagenome]|uniref:Uncharacterized protein n=1 Tax=marine sediment metagenome TaxID=412755 RepID=A0A0F9TH98_9ZZZZ
MSRYRVTFEVDYDPEDAGHSLMEKVRQEIKETGSVNSQQLAELEELDIKELMLEELIPAFIGSRSPFSKPELTGVANVP